jgi:hypothetical protein
LEQLAEMDNAKPKKGKKRQIELENEGLRDYLRQQHVLAKPYQKQHQGIVLEAGSIMKNTK